jgi:hypothetical protein
VLRQKVAVLLVFNNLERTIIMKKRYTKIALAVCAAASLNYTPSSCMQPSSIKIEDSPRLLAITDDISALKRDVAELRSDFAKITDSISMMNELLKQLQPASSLSGSSLPSNVAGLEGPNIYEFKNSSFCAMTYIQGYKLIADLPLDRQVAILKSMSRPLNEFSFLADVVRSADGTPVPSGVLQLIKKVTQDKAHMIQLIRSVLVYDHLRSDIKELIEGLIKLFPAEECYYRSLLQ